MKRTLVLAATVALVASPASLASPAQQAARTAAQQGADLFNARAHVRCATAHRCTVRFSGGSLDGCRATLVVRATPAEWVVSARRLKCLASR